MKEKIELTPKMKFHSGKGGKSDNTFYFIIKLSFALLRLKRTCGRSERNFLHMRHLSEIYEKKE